MALQVLIQIRAMAYRLVLAPYAPIQPVSQAYLAPHASIHPVSKASQLRLFGPPMFVANIPPQISSEMELVIK